MTDFAQEILQGLEQDTIIRLDLFVTQGFQTLQFITSGSIGRNFEVTLPVDCANRLTWSSTIYIDQKPYNKTPLFSEISFNKLKDALLLNTSLKYWANNFPIYSKEQCDYFDKITLRNIYLSQISGITLLHYAAMYGDIDVVQIYSWRAKHANELEVKCQNGKTPLDYARESNHLIIMSFLENQIRKLRSLETEIIEPSITQIKKPLSDTTKQHIFNSLRVFSKLPCIYGKT